MRKRSIRYLLCGLSLAAIAFPALAAFEPEQARIEVLGNHQDKNWFWIWGNNAPNMVDGRAYLFDDSGQNLGQLSTGMWSNGLVFFAQAR